MDIKYMKRALELAEEGMGKTRPNPLVGAVIVRDDKIISEGFHKVYGGDHAELDALKKINFQGEGTTLYVNLEPCSHYGKTPPCVEAIIRAGIKTVVVAMTDPNPLVAGRGIKILQDHGIEVIHGVLEEEARRLNEIFIKYITTSKPFLILKTAMSMDGKIATAEGNSKWITGEESRYYVHQIRNRVAGIMVGITTVIKDNPRLNTRLPLEEVSHPTRVIVDSSLRIPLDSIVVETASQQPTIIATTNRGPKEKLLKLKDKHVEIIILPEKNNRVDLNQLMIELGKRRIDSILLEGGGTLNYSALEEGIVDKMITFIAPKILGGTAALTPVEGEGKINVDDAFMLNDLRVGYLGKDLLIEGYFKGDK
ncbi:bifunctional diaminohydroxyphosphoribosylaminopyrimidine deaminase/5-amino-6-(5-phosphoribosylamino)uracil reductase RibD [Alkaliphilus serpentinus]|uniref:Riboflavin biosynthesis protein RibD n=1 Tax=Alkaliphilus serpentinus TaxID=1482731 RepID=A0A833M6N9_9FIRM|nr:bifunctional diaminohydroxyphosphoribosylaminopyrimidine deaminase/5-amino-6-(5-phosphoribosylamino)uracil reductase RibD [Alkaliphilus serpentinus]KAB3528799.1 bifunctional diaminohydroxyphosphoribosylaminopyrimidine deaminase/5-amino-6-(5-phosphoribosylamino)uracil reductase RibD [Alkaliphilus serpentinus]